MKRWKAERLFVRRLVHRVNEIRFYTPLICSETSSHLFLLAIYNKTLSLYEYEFLSETDIVSFEILPWRSV